MARSVVVLPPAVGETIEVYLNGVRQEPDTDFHRDSDTLIFERTLRRDHIAGWRWLLGASGIGTYRQDDVVDVRYEVDGQTRLAHGLPVAPLDNSG
jgi:hypothetical protein